MRGGAWHSAHHGRDQSWLLLTENDYFGFFVKVHLRQVSHKVYCLHLPSARPRPLRMEKIQVT